MISKNWAQFYLLNCSTIHLKTESACTQNILIYNTACARILHRFSFINHNELKMLCTFESFLLQP